MGDKEDTLDSSRQLVIHQTQWSDYSEKVLGLITINGNDDVVNQNNYMTQNTFPFRICNVQIPTYNISYVCMLV